MKTVITHFYNEEYLLPRWLEHHKKIFDFGICIDYASTDRSVEIIREICPHWQIFPSYNKYFDAEECDREIEFYERQLPDWRIALTVTEFLLGNIDKLCINTEHRTQWFIPGIRFTEWNPYGKLDSRPLWEQLTTGVHYLTDPLAHQCRSLHNFNDITYTTGRHFLPYNTEEVCIFHYAHCIVGESMLKRRLQIQNKISVSDKTKMLGNHHYIDINGMDINNLEIMHKQWITLGESDCTDIIKRMTVTQM